MRRIVWPAAVAVGLVALACGGSPPTTVDVPGPAVAVTEDGGTVTASAGRKILISGDFAIVGAGEPSRVLVTPGGITHVFSIPADTEFTGAVEGLVTFTESWTDHKDGSTSYHGPFEGDVKWNGRSGEMSGQWHANCAPGECGGTFEGHGSEGLDGVHFHFEWTPGATMFEFKYTGFVIDTSK